MANNQQLTVGLDVVDYHTQFSYPVTAFVLQAESDGKKIHIIWYQGAPSTDFAKAPNGSIIIDYTVTTCHVYVKDYGTNGAGGIDGSWRSHSVT